jgi:DNA repair exonuclease SbcCD ATPase subunit
MTEIINNFSIKLETFSEMWKNDLLSNKFDPNLSWEKIIQYIKQTELDNLERENELIAHLNSLNTEIETKSYIDIKSEDLEEDISDISEKIIRIDKNLEPFSKRNINEEEIITLENIQHLETHLEKEKEGLHLIEFTLNRVNEEKSKIQTLKNQTEEIELQKENVIKEIAQLYSETENMKTNTYEKFSFENFEEFKIAEEKKISNMKSILNSISYKKTALLTEIAHLKGELKGFETLTERYNSLSDKIYILKTKIQKIDLDLKACPEIKKGLIETTKHIKAGFIPEFSHYVGRILSHITLDRYHKIKVDNDLTIKIYSPEKNDFIYPFQLSGGTSDQLMLAIRLAFANTLLQNRGQKFLFLDEHLASFDNNRKETFLDILKYLEFSFDQIILISHLSGMEKYMDSHIFLDKTETTVIRKTLNQ